MRQFARCHCLRVVTLCVCVFVCNICTLFVSLWARVHSGMAATPLLLFALCTQTPICILSQEASISLHEYFHDISCVQNFASDKRRCWKFAKQKKNRCHRHDNIMHIHRARLPPMSSRHTHTHTPLCNFPNFVRIILSYVFVYERTNCAVVS